MYMYYQQDTAQHSHHLQLKNMQILHKSLQS